VWTPDDDAVAAGHSVDPAGWRVLFDELMSLVAGRFGRAEPRRAAREFVAGLLSPLERKNCWWLAEQAGHGDPQAMQRLLRTAVWDADKVRDDVRGFVAGQFGDPAGVLICDETGFLKKGTGSVGVQRQYSGTAGRVENCQVGVFLSYASPRGRALIDRRVYLPKSWAEDQPRCAAAGVPADTQFATKPDLALDMITGAVAAKVPAAWVAADEVYGDNGAFRAKGRRARPGLCAGGLLRPPDTGFPRRQAAAARRSHRRRPARALLAPHQRRNRVQGPALV
jgi:SRSO17 transposase